jgi:hypothetical protein
MVDAHCPRSEVACLLARIREEYEAAQRGLSGLASGTSQHAFISAKMENIGTLHTQLHDLVGDAAIAMIAEHFEPKHPAADRTC